MPKYGNATHFFEPMPRSTLVYLCISAQVQRLVAVLSARGVSKGALLSAGELDVSRLRKWQQEALTTAGWVPGTGLRSLLNFTGVASRGPVTYISSLSACGIAPAGVGQRWSFEAHSVWKRALLRKYWPDGD